MTTQRQFFTQKQRKIEYSLLEIYHETIGLIRLVRGRINPLSVTLEASAPRNPSAVVEFTGGYFEYQKPQQNNGNISMEIQLGRVGRDVKSKLKQIKAAGTQFSPADAIIRNYIGGELGDPVFVLRLYISTITMTPEGVGVLCQLDNPSGRSVATLFTTEVFPGLSESI